MSPSTFSLVLFLTIFGATFSLDCYDCDTDLPNFPCEPRQDRKSKQCTDSSNLCMTIALGTKALFSACTHPSFIFFLGGQPRKCKLLPGEKLLDAIRIINSNQNRTRRRRRSEGGAQGRLAATRVETYVLCTCVQKDLCNDLVGRPGELYGELYPYAKNDKTIPERGTHNNGGVGVLHSLPVFVIMSWTWSAVTVGKALASL